MIVNLDGIMKQEMNQNIPPKTEEIPVWIKNGIPEWILTALFIALSLLAVAVLFDGLF